MIGIGEQCQKPRSAESELNRAGGPWKVDPEDRERRGVSSTAQPPPRRQCADGYKPERWE